MIFGPIIMIVMAIALLFSFVGGTVTEVANGGIVAYDEEAIQDYADDQYAQVFGRSTAYEDNLLLLFLTTENNQGYAYIAWVGDHVAPEVNYLFGGNGSELGTAMDQSINTANYKYSLDSNLAMVVNRMQGQVEVLGLEDTFVCAEDHVQVKSHMENKTDLALTADTVNGALESFTEATGIPLVIVVEEAETVFGRSLSGRSWIGVIFAVILLILAIVLIVKAVKRRRNDPGEDRSRRDYDPM